MNILRCRVLFQFFTNERVEPDQGNQLISVFLCNQMKQDELKAALLPFFLGEQGQSSQNCILGAILEESLLTVFVPK